MMVLPVVEDFDSEHDIAMLAACYRFFSRV